MTASFFAVLKIPKQPEMPKGCNLKLKLLYQTMVDAIVPGDVSVIDVENLKVIKSIKVGRYHWGVVIDPTS